MCLQSILEGVQEDILNRAKLEDSGYIGGYQSFLCLQSVLQGILISEWRLKLGDFGRQKGPG